MFDYTFDQREEEYQKFNRFTKKIDEEIVDIVSTLGWSMESTKSDSGNTLVCPYDLSHRISRKTLVRHLELCQWKKEGYDEHHSVPLPESAFSSSSPFSIKLDPSLQNSILQEAKEKNSTMKTESYQCSAWHKFYFLSNHEFLTLIIGRGERLIPQTSDRIFTDFTCDERKALYEYVVSHTMKTDIGHDITDTRKQKGQDKDDKKLSFLELLVQERNLKRRRAKHKGVHTNKKSHTEILREVINQQMEVYTDCMTEMQAFSCGTKTDAVAELGHSNRNCDNLVQFNETPSKRRNTSFEGSQQDYRETSNFRCEQKYEQFEKSSSSYEKHLDKREKYSRTWSESWKTHKSRKHKRSRSRERDHDRRRKRDSTRQDYKRHNERYYETEKSSNCNKYSKRKDHRENREKVEL